MMAYCGHCGAQLVDGDEFCRKCGTPVSSAVGAPGETSARRTGRIALIVAAVVLGLLVLGGLVYLAVLLPVSSRIQEVSTTGVTSTTAGAGSDVATTGAGQVATIPPPPPVSPPEVPPVKPKSLTADDVTHEATFITKTGIGKVVPTLTFDYVQFLTGAAATKAAAAHGDTVENDYYVANDNTKLRTFPVSSAIVIKLHPGDGPELSRNFTFAEFKSLMAGGSATYGGKTYDWSAETTYYINVKNGEVTRVENQWVP
jgi:hypothetical protein